MRPSPEELAGHADFVRRLARSLSADEPTADDLAQEAILAALERPPPRDENLRAWFRKVVRNLFLKSSRGRARRMRRELEGAKGEAVDPFASADDRRAVAEAVVRLDEPYRSAVLLRFYDGLSPVEIAGRIGVPVKTVHTRLRRASERLRAALAGGAFGVALLPTERGMKMGGIMAAGGKIAAAAAGFALGVGSTVLYREVTAPAAPPSARVASARHAPAEESPPAAAAGIRAKEAPRAAEAPILTAEEYLRRINALEEPRMAEGVAHTMAGLPDGAGVDMMVAIHARIENAEKREVVLQPFRGSPRYLDILDLGARDRDPKVRQAAYALLGSFAYMDFTEAPELYEVWRRRTEGLPTLETVRRSAEEFAQRVRSLAGDALAAELRRFDNPPRPYLVGADLAALWREAGILDAMEPLVLREPPAGQGEAEERDRQIRAAAWNWIHGAAPPEEFVRRVALPVLQDGGGRREEDLAPAIGLLVQAKPAYAFDTLVGLLGRMPPGTKSLWFTLGDALGDLGDRRAIPHLIREIAEDNGYWTVYGLGYFGLRPLTGVPYDKKHDGAWWLSWWDRNRDGLPAEVRAIDPR